jgi:dienelactone hydrolase
MLRCISLLPLIALIAQPAFADEKSLAEAVRKLEPNVIAVEGKVTKKQRDELRRMLSTDVRTRRRKANLADVEGWRKIKTVKQWEAFRDARIAALKKSLGTFPSPPKDLKLRVLKTIPGDGFVIRNIVFQSRPKLWVTANLYSPRAAGFTPAGSSKSRRDEPGGSRKRMPGILIVHSHHRPKTQGELQDMGMIWARAGCTVLVMDQLGHGERRQHPFRSAKDFPKRFPVSRQDYHFRYNTGMQLNLLGDSLIGWMAWDLMRGVDLLLKQPGIDPKRIILLGAVAAGGDPCAVTAAIDKRIAAAVPFNFGGPQPESIFPLPKDAELSFNYMGGGSWESTRNLRLSGRDGFLPWVIVAAIAPRRLVYAHEFSWDRKHDPVWKRLQTIYRWYGKPENLASTHGHGKVTLSSKVASHCTNIGSEHRKAGIYAAFEKWFGIPAPKTEYRKRLPESQLLCVDPPFSRDPQRPFSRDSKSSERSAAVKLTPLTEITTALAKERAAAIGDKLRDKAQKQWRGILRQEWKKVLGDVKPERQVEPRLVPSLVKGGFLVYRLGSAARPPIRVPFLLLTPNDRSAKPRPVIVCVSQSGKAAFLKERSDVIAQFLNAGCAVCLPDLRGTGETRSGTYRGRRSSDTGLSSSELMLGGTMVGKRLKDLRSVLALLRTWKIIDGKRIALWGDSFAKINPRDRNVALPMPADNEPPHSEPLGHILVLLAALFEDDVKAVVSNRGGLVSYRSVLRSPFVYVPHDVIVPGAIAAGDLDFLPNFVSPTPVWFGGLVDGENKPASDADLGVFKINRGFDLGIPARIGKPDSAAAARWLIERLKK